MFKVGDKVKVITNRFSGWEGLTGAIEIIESEGAFLPKFYRVHLPSLKEEEQYFNPFPFLENEIELTIPKIPDWRI